MVVLYLSDRKVAVWGGVVEVDVQNFHGGKEPERSDVASNKLALDPHKRNPTRGRHDCISHVKVREPCLTCTSLASFPNDPSL